MGAAGDCEFRSRLQHFGFVEEPGSLYVDLGSSGAIPSTRTRNVIIRLVRDRDDKPCSVKFESIRV